MLIKSENSLIIWSHRLVDAVSPLLMLCILFKITEAPIESSTLVLGLASGLLFLMLGQLFGNYINWKGKSALNIFGKTAITWSVTWSITVLVLFFVSIQLTFPKEVLIYWFISNLSFLFFHRVVARFITMVTRKNTGALKKVAIFGAGKLGLNLSSVIEKDSWLGLKLVAFYDDNQSLLGKKFDSAVVKGALEELFEDARNAEFDELYICLPMRAEKRIKEILLQLTDSTIVVKLVPDLFTFDLMHSRISNLKGIPIVSVFDTPFNSLTARLIKKIEDLVLSSLILILISPIMLALAIGVKLTSPGPVFYRQTRIGWNGEKFEMLKFRSMPVDTESTGVQWGNAGSKTKTRFGAFIRSTSLDELPQFINVLLGDMSIVGPRPERDVFVEKFRKEVPRYMQKHMAKAGITGWAQINGWRGDTSLEKRIEFDLSYINNWSLWLDIKIIIMTVFKGFVNKNAV